MQNGPSSKVHCTRVILSEVEGSAASRLRNTQPPIHAFCCGCSKTPERVMLLLFGLWGISWAPNLCSCVPL